MHNIDYKKVKTFIKFQFQINAVLLNFLFIKESLKHIWMISEGSCDTEDWSNDAENTDLHHRNKLHFKIYLNRNLSNNISQFDCFYQINAASMSVNHFKKKHLLI